MYLHIVQTTVVLHVDTWTRVEHCSSATMGHCSGAANDIAHCEENKKSHRHCTAKAEIF